MAYTKTVWSAGDTVTSTKLNKIEQGIYDAVNSGGVFYINVISDYNTSTEEFTNTISPAVTGQDILDAVDAGKLVCIKITYKENNVSIPGLAIGQLESYAYDGVNKHEFEFSSSFIQTLFASSLSSNLAVSDGGDIK